MVVLLVLEAWTRGPGADSAYAEQDAEQVRPEAETEAETGSN
jgi:hypothetical protein